MRHVTLKDIAGHLGLSPSTVSRALAGDTKINQKTRLKIVEAATRMGYRRNVVAASLRSGRSNTVGIIMNEFTSPFGAVALEAMQRYLHDRDIRVMIASSGYDPKRELTHLQTMQHSMIDGLIMGFCHYDDNLPEFQRLLDHNFPIVFLAHTLPELQASCVVMDAYERAFFLVEHLVRTGRRRIVFVLGPLCVRDMSDLLHGYCDALAKFGIEPLRPLNAQAGWLFYEGLRIADSIADNYADVDAVMTYNDLIATGVLTRLRQRGIDVPGKVAVASFYGTPLADIVSPTITTVETSITNMGNTAAQLLLDRIEDPAAPPQRIVVESQIKVRESTVAIPEKYITPFSMHTV